VSAFILMSAAPAVTQQPPAGSCYKLSAGEWHGSYQLRSTTVFPVTVQFDTAQGTSIAGPMDMAFRTSLPAPVPKYTHWKRTSADSIELSWGSGFGAIRIDAVVRDDRLTGKAIATTDFDTGEQQNPTAAITGERVLCREEQLARQADEDQVVIALIDSVYRRETKILLMDSTRSAFAHDDWRTNSDGIDPSLARDYRIANNESRSWRGLLPGRVKFEVTPRDVTVRPWLNVSRVGFNADRTVAIVDAFLGCGPRCGYGGLFILKKTDGAWRIISNPIISAS
jgi:hypothetical protein